jgi:hypothetical protein
MSVPGNPEPNPEVKVSVLENNVGTEAEVEGSVHEAVFGYKEKKEGLWVRAS